MHNGELQIGNAGVETEHKHFLQRLGLDPLMEQLAENDATARAPLDHKPLEDFYPGRARTFLLVLEARTSLDELYPRLVEQLDTLRQRGYLTHWDGQNVVPRHLTVVVTGEAFPESDCVHHSYSDVFWSLPEGQVLNEFTKDGGHLSPVCV